MTLTKKELTVLELIKEEQNEKGHSDFLSHDAKSKSVAGVVSSLEKKGMVYNSYSDMTKEDFANEGTKPFKMWCLTDEGCEIIGTPKWWL